MMSDTGPGGRSFRELSIRVLADHPELVGPVGELRWKEWGRAPQPENLQWWIDATRREAGREILPVTFIAVGGNSSVIGAVGLGEFDLEERRDRSPWILGMIVRADHRGVGVGRRLLEYLEEWATGRGITRLWVANEGDAVGFYRTCGWDEVELVPRLHLPPATVLSRHLGP